MGDGLHGCFVHRPWVTGDVAALCFDRAATTLTLKHRRLCRVYVMDSIGALAPCPEGTLACARAPPFAGVWGWPCYPLSVPTAQLTARLSQHDFTTFGSRRHRVQ